MGIKKVDPIGIFDSGVGGLTIAKAIVQHLPQEAICYFGDTAHLPYGDKSSATIQNYALVIVEKLLKENCKVILIACNTASAAALEVIQDYVGERAIVVDVIKPLVNFLIQHYAQKRIGLIGTKLTVQSNVYGKMLGQVQLNAMATPLLVPIIEEGFGQHKLIDMVLKEYLTAPKLRDIELLVLACTHYPLIKKQIRAFYHDKIAVLDATTIVAAELAQLLATRELLNPEGGLKRFYVSDLTDTFVAQAKMFFGANIILEYHPL